MCFLWSANDANVGLTSLFSATATYDFVAIEDTGKDKVLDVLFILKNADGSENKTCDSAGIKLFF